MMLCLRRSLTICYEACVRRSVKAQQVTGTHPLQHVISTRVYNSLLPITCPSVTGDDYRDLGSSYG
jgi:hypothetical protein